jgi:hypothetical protein
MTEPRRVDPLHGVTLQAMLEHLQERYGWAGLGARIDIRCFTDEPSIALRKGLQHAIITENNGVRGAQIINEVGDKAIIANNEPEVKAK